MVLSGEVVGSSLLLDTLDVVPPKHLLWCGLGPRPEIRASRLRCPGFLVCHIQKTLDSGYADRPETYQTIRRRHRLSYFNN